MFVGRTNYISSCFSCCKIKSTAVLSLDRKLTSAEAALFFGFMSYHAQKDFVIVPFSNVPKPSIMTMQNLNFAVSVYMRLNF